MKKDTLAEIVEQTINSMDAAERATPAPYLLTRINARLNNAQPPLTSAWEWLSAFLSRPGIALATICFLIIINLVIYSYSNNASDINNMQNMQAYMDDYSINNSSALFDLENMQP